MDEVQQDGPAATALLSAPGLGVGEVGGGFEGGPEAAYGGYGADGAAGEEVFGRQRMRVKAAVVADEESDVVVSRCGDQTGGGAEIGADGLFAEDVDAGFGELGGQRDVGVVRGADDGGVGPVMAGEEGRDGGVEGGGMEGRSLEGGGAGVYYCDEGGGGIGRDVLTVSLSNDAAAADDGDL